MGRPSRKAVARFVGTNKKKLGIDAVIANSDNLAHGRGVTRKTVEEMLAVGVDFLTCGDHAWDTPQAFDIAKAGDLNFVLPANVADADRDLCAKTFEMGGVKIMVMNLLGTVFIDRGSTSAFEAADAILKKNEAEDGAKIIILDFHAEATSEKKALGRFLDGRVSAVLGTHTHVQTADESILRSGTAYITDAGMVGVKDSILGCEEGSVLDQYRNGAPFKYKLAEDDRVGIEGVLLDIDEKSGKARSIERLQGEVFIGD